MKCYCSKLTSDESTLLNEHDGCRKCRKEYQDHCANNCPHGFPDGENYALLTTEMMLQHKRLYCNDLNVAKKNKDSSNKTVNAVVDDNSNHSDSINAILPSAVIGNGSDSDDVSDIPLQTKHLIFKCTVNGPNVDEPITVNALLDNGAHIVLTRPSLVDTLGLYRHHLHKPEPYYIAVAGSHTFKNVCVKYVLLSVTSLDQTWTSNTVKALITTGLSTELILSLPFLERNHIVIDHHERAAIDKPVDYDLLNPPKVKAKLYLPSKTELKRLVRQTVRETKKVKKIVLDELLKVTKV